MLDDFVEAKRDGICGKIGDRFININNTMVKHERSPIDPYGK